jgi:hypothetical protein
MKAKTYKRVNPHPKKYASNAERQRAYRKRRRDSSAESDRRFLRSVGSFPICRGSPYK